jgi:hypothetical protein
MYLVREVFKARPGRARELVAKFKQVIPLMPVPGVKARRVMTDTVAAYWTVVMESEGEDLQAYLDMGRNRMSDPKVDEAMKGYMDLVYGGHREIFRIE